MSERPLKTVKFFSLAAAFFSAALLLQAFFSCANFEDSAASQNVYEVQTASGGSEGAQGGSGDLVAFVALVNLPRLQAAADSSAAKSAFPGAAQLSSSSYTFTATLSSASGGSHSASGTYDGDAGTCSFRFGGLLSDSAQTWTLDLSLHYSDGGEKQEIASGTKSVALAAGASSFSADVQLFPKEGCAVNGSISLPIKFSDSSVTSVGVQLLNSSAVDVAATYLGGSSVALLNGEGTISSASGGVPSGSYTLLLTFMSGGSLVGSRTESVNVFPGLLTNIWWTGGSAALTLNVLKYEQKEFWVRGTGGSFYTSVFALAESASDQNSGSFAFPLATVQEAISRIQTSGDTESEYTIYIDGIVSASSSGDYSENNNSLASVSAQRKILLRGYSSSSSDILDASAASGVRVLYVSGGASVALMNITLTGGNVSTGYGGGAYVGANSSLSMQSDSRAQGNSAQAGGGVYAAASSTLDLSGATIAGNSAANGGGIMNLGACFIYGDTVIGDSSASAAPSSSQASNSATSYGGGVYNTGSLYLGYSAWTSESVNTPKPLTGGVYANYSDEHAAGIYNPSGTVKMASGNIRFNGLPSGAHQGAGVFTKAVFEMSGGLVDSNSCDMGAGINVSSETGSFTMSGGTISNNVSSGSGGGGGGVLVSNGASFVMDDGLIEKNSAARGGGIWNWDSSTTINGGSISQNSGTYGGGVCVYTSDFTSAIASVVSMTGGEIVSNTGIAAPNSYGAGVYIERNAKFSMSGGTISENEAICGGAVFINLDNESAASWGTFEVSGSSYISAGLSGVMGEGKNDVYTTMPLTISGTLSHDAPIATITPFGYSAGIQVLNGTSALLSANYTKFALSPDSDGSNWTISSAGLLQWLSTATIVSMTSGGTVKVTGQVTNEQIKSINQALKTLALSSPTALISLDLSEASMTELESVDITDYSTGNNSFFGCANLESVVLPEGLTTIGNYAFFGCSNLKSVTIPSSVTKIGTNAFGTTNSLSSVVFEDASAWSAGAITLSSSDLSNASTAATYLNTTYCLYEWNKN